MTVIEPSDEKLLEAARAEPGLLDRLKNQASAAYYQARGVEDNYVVADKVWNDLHRTWHHNHIITVAANPNSPADQKARVDTLRATQQAIENFNNLAGKELKKSAPPVPTALAAQRLFGVYDSPLETVFANMQAAAPDVHPLATLPQTFAAHPPSPRRRAVSGGR